MSEFIKTVISHNYGQTFSSVTPPALNSKEALYACSSDASTCKLQLHLIGSQSSSPLFSSPTCPGILIGSGNVGTYLSDSSEGGTFLSEDGGLHWRELIPGISVSTISRECDIVTSVGARGTSPSIAWSFDRVGGGVKLRGQSTAGGTQVGANPRHTSFPVHLDPSRPPLDLNPVDAVHRRLLALLLRPSERQEMDSWQSDHGREDHHRWPRGYRHP